MRKTREAKAKEEAKTEERSRAWSNSKYKEKAEITRLADKDRENAEFGTKARKNSNAVNRAGSKEREDGG